MHHTPKLSVLEFSCLGQRWRPQPLSIFYCKVVQLSVPKWISWFYGNLCFDLATKKSLVISIFRDNNFCILHCQIVFHWDSHRAALVLFSLAVPMENNIPVKEASSQVTAVKNNNYNHLFDCHSEVPITVELWDSFCNQAKTQAFFSPLFFGGLLGVGGGGGDGRGGGGGRCCDLHGSDSSWNHTPNWTSAQMLLKYFLGLSNSVFFYAHVCI